MTACSRLFGNGLHLFVCRIRRFAGLPEFPNLRCPRKVHVWGLNRGRGGTMRLELRSEMVDFGRFCQAFINREMYTYGSGSTKFGSKCTQNESELKTREPFFFSLSGLGEGGPIFFLWRGSKGAGADPIPCLWRPTKRFLYSSKIGVHWLPKVSVLREDRSSGIFCTHRIGVEPLFEAISVRTRIGVPSG